MSPARAPQSTATSRIDFAIALLVETMLQVNNFHQWEATNPMNTVVFQEDRACKGQRSSGARGLVCGRGRCCMCGNGVPSAILESSCEQQSEPTTRYCRTCKRTGFSTLRLNFSATDFQKGFGGTTPATVHRRCRVIVYAW